MTGDDGYAAALAARERLPADGRARYRPYPFLREELLEALVRRGPRRRAGRLVDAGRGDGVRDAVGRRAVPARGGHQTANARELVDAGAARLVPDEAFDAGALM